MKTKWPSLLILALTEVLALALWFSATAVVPVLRAEYGLDGFHASLFTSAVQLGFVVGTLISAGFGLADRLDPRAFFMCSALVAGTANAAILLLDPLSAGVPAMRFITGMCMAGIYPVGMKLMASWASGDVGLLVGLLVGALTLGSATPHLFNAFSGVDWQLTIALSSLAAWVSGGLVLLVGIGSHFGRAARFHPRHALAAWTTPSLRLANLGYLGHMWELYAMWAWIAVFLQASFAQGMAAGPAAFYARLGAFATIAVGMVGCLLGGLFADRFGRTTLTMGAMAISGTCAVAVGFLFGGNAWALMALCLVWGISIIADSAQFSASVAELADPTLVGTMLTVQTSLGFLLTLFSIHMIPRLVDVVGWHYAFAFLAIGPFFGVWAMGRLRGHPDAIKLAGGQR